MNRPSHDAGARPAPAPPRISIRGQLAIESGPVIIRETRFPGRQVRWLWVYLVLNRRGPVGRGELAEPIWGEDVPDAWDVALNALVSRLRRCLAPIAPAAEIAILGEQG